MSIFKTFRSNLLGIAGMRLKVNSKSGSDVSFASTTKRKFGSVTPKKLSKVWNKSSTFITVVWFSMSSTDS